MSNTRDTVTEWLKEISGGEDNFQYRDDGVYTYAAEGDLEVTVEIPQAGEFVYLYTTVAAIPEEGAEALYARALRMNLLNAETRGATLALDDRNPGLILSYSAPVATLDVVSLGNAIGNFLDAAAAVREKFADVSSEVPVLTRSADLGFSAIRA